MIAAECRTREDFARHYASVLARTRGTAPATRPAPRVALALPAKAPHTQAPPTPASLSDSEPEPTAAGEFHDTHVVARAIHNAGATYRGIIAAVAYASGVPRDQLLGKRRLAAIARPRLIAAYLIKKLRPETSLPEIGRRLGGRDHTTALHAVRKIERHRADPRVAALIETACAVLGVPVP